MNDRRKWQATGGFALGGLLASAAAAAIEPAAPPVAVVGRCPAAADVERSLRGAVPIDRAPTALPRVLVEDRGAAVRVTVGAVVRVIDDPRRDCSARAERAALLVALGLYPPAFDERPALPPDPPPPPAPSPPPVGAPASDAAPPAVADSPLGAAPAGPASAGPAAQQHRPLVRPSAVTPRPRPGGRALRAAAGLAVAGEVASSPGAPSVGGAALRVELLRGWVGGSLGASIAWPATVGFAGGHARLWRMPLDASATVTLRRPRYALALDVGLALVPTVASGVDLVNPRSAALLDWGVRVGGRAAVWLVGPLALWFGLEAIGVPTPQALETSDSGILGRTPTFIAGGYAGLWLGLP